MSDEQQITAAVRERYHSIAERVTDGQIGHCCGGDVLLSGNTISADLYAPDELAGIPLKAALASLGCGNPTALAALAPGEVVLDLGSGGGIDVLLSARRVAPDGIAYGLDMTDSMLELARQNAAEAGVENVRWLKGEITAIPLPDASVDVIISNCVINLAANKQPVFEEAFRVLKPGGRFAVSDIVIHGSLPASITDAMRRELLAWAGCIAGALTDTEYRHGLAQAGFTDIDLEITRRYTLTDIADMLPALLKMFDAELIEQAVQHFASTFVRATKPA